MATEPVNIPDQLMTKVKEAASREQITVEELVRDALEKRVNGKGRFARFYEIGERHARETGAVPEDVEKEIAANRTERGR